MNPDIVKTIRAAYVEAIPALEAIDQALAAAPDDDEAQERHRVILVELAFSRACERALKRAKAVEVAVDRRHTSKAQPTQANIESTDRAKYERGKK